MKWLQANVTPLVGVIAAAGIALVIGLLIFFVLIKPGQDRTARRTAEGTAAVATGGLLAGQDAAKVIANTSTEADQLDRQQEETARDIAQAKDASNSAGDAGLRGLLGLCRQPANRDVERCRKLLEAHP